MTELARLDATAQAALVRRGEATPAELIAAAIARIERVNPTLNAVIAKFYDRAQGNPRAPTMGPFQGVPYLVKDVLARVAGAPATAGSAALADNIDERDSELVARMRRAGLVLIGKTNTPEFGLLPTTEPRLFGPTRNPWNPALSPGGSSGGSAAAVAARLVPFAHANDGGGSIRIPASCCGLFGLKPSRGRVPLGPDRNDLFGIVAEHAVTISVRDSAALLDATSGAMGGEAFWCPAPTRPFALEVGAPAGRLRIAWTARAPAGTPIHSDCAAAVEDAARLCETLGHEVFEGAPALDGEKFYRAFVDLWAVSCATTVDVVCDTRGRERTLAAIEPFTRALWEQGRRMDAVAHTRVRETLANLSRKLDRFMAGVDLWLTPTLGHPPPPLGHFGHLAESADLAERVLARSAEFVPFTPLANMAGLPAMSVPLHWNAHHLPIGTHFMARFGEEATLFRLAAQFEHARPWTGRLPPIAA